MTCITLATLSLCATIGTGMPGKCAGKDCELVGTFDPSTQVCPVFKVSSVSFAVRGAVPAD